MYFLPSSGGISPAQAHCASDRGAPGGRCSQSPAGLTHCKSGRQAHWPLALSLQVAAPTRPPLPPATFLHLPALSSTGASRGRLVEHSTPAREVKVGPGWFLFYFLTYDAATLQLAQLSTLVVCAGCLPQLVAGFLLSIPRLNQLPSKNLKKEPAAFRVLFSLAPRGPGSNHVNAVNRVFSPSSPHAWPQRPPGQHCMSQLINRHER